MRSLALPAIAFYERRISPHIYVPPSITHYTIRSASDILLTEYVAQMQKFLGIERLPIEQAIERGGRWINA